MEDATAGTIVKIWAVLSWVWAALMLLGGVALLFAGSVLGGAMASALAGNLAEEGVAAGAAAGMSMAFGVLLLAMGVLYVFVGFGLWRRRSWARITTVVLSVLSLLSFPIGTILGILGIWLFGFQDDVKAQFA